MTVLLLIGVGVLSAAAEWWTRPPTRGRRNAPQVYRRPRHHASGRHAEPRRAARKPVAS